MKNAVFAVSLALLLVICLSGCGGAGDTTPATTEAPSVATEDPVTVSLSFPDGAPKLNESGVFKCAIINNTATDKNVSIDIDVPKTALTLESGSLSWNGNAPANSETTVIEVMLKAFHTGHWQIDASYHIDTGTGSSGGDFVTTIYVNLGMTSSQWGVTPPWQK